MAITTTAVTAVRSGTAFSIDVTACNLLTDTTIKDFRVIDTDADSEINVANFTKDSSIQISYSGPDIGTSVNLEVRRDTPLSRFQEILYQTRLSSNVVNTEFDRILRRQVEYDTFGVGPTSQGVSNEPLDQTYSSSWESDTVRGRTAHVLYDQIEAMVTETATKTTLSAVQEALYPVGSIYVNATNSTNPATLLNFGTWAAFGAGRVPVGFDSSDTDFDIAEETGGSKTHTLTTAQMPSHSHPSSDGAHPRFVYIDGSNTENLIDATGSGATAFNGTASLSSSSVTGTRGDGEEFDILQPYITVYMWKRTA